MYFLGGTSLASDNIEVSTSVDKNEITVGDIIEYNVTVKFDKDFKLDFPEKGLNLGEFELLDFSKSESEAEGLVVRNYIYKISIYNTGDFELPFVEFQYIDRDGKEKIKKTEKPCKIKVKSILPEDANDIRDIKSPREFINPFPYSLVFIIILLVIIILLFIFIGLRIYFTINKRKEIISPLLSPEVEAYKALDELVSSDLLNNGEIKEFYIRLSDIIRRYVERRFNIMTFEKTTEEIMAQIERREEERIIIDSLNTLLMDFDLVKFAKFIPSMNECSGHVLKCRNFVEKTTPEEKPLEEVLSSKETGGN